MKTYLWVTGSLFGVLTAVHIWRMIVESSTRDPWYMLITAISGALCIWAFGLLRSTSARS